MFQESNYELTEFSVAPNGMNQFVSPDVLSPNFCYLLENIIPEPLGVGQVRYGTSLISNLSNPEFDIMRAFPFTHSGNIYQSILYIAYYVQDMTADEITVISQSHVDLESVTPNDYIKDTKIKINYTLDAAPYTLYSDLKNVIVDDTSVSLFLENNLLPDPTSGVLVITGIFRQYGSIYSYNFNTNTLSAPLKTLLSVACCPRPTYISEALVICNGVNNVMYWDGVELKDWVEFVLEKNSTNSFTKVLGNIVFTKIDGFDISKYFIGNLINLQINGISNILTIAGNTVLLNVVTLSTIEAVPAFTGADTVSLFYQDKPPAFSYIYTAKDRLWALGPGSVGLEYRDTDQQLRAYYSYETNPDPRAKYGLFNENTKTVPSIPMSDKHNIQDNFEAICQVNGFIAFVGRKITQVWSGSDPSIGGDFAWNSNLQIGIFHGDLLVELANDVYFVSQNGVTSFGTLNVARQFSASFDNAVNPIVKSFVLDAYSSNSKYRKCVSFKYNDGNFCGFKISNNKILASLFSNKLDSWFYLSGDFGRASCFMEINKQLYMFVGNKIFKYANGNDGGQKKYGDNDGNSLIQISWTPGLIKFKGRKGYANKRYELSINYPSSFILNDKNIIEILIFGDIPKSFKLRDKCEFEQRGDLFGEEPLSISQGERVDPGFKLRKEFEIVNKKLKFVASSFWLSISGYVINGPITFRRIRLFGIGERNA